MRVIVGAMAIHSLCMVVAATTIIERAVEGAFKFRPLFSFMKQQARNAMVTRGKTIGVNWDTNVQALQLHQQKLQTNLDALFNAPVIYPSYYLQSFHAYDEGNLSWQAAMEVESAAKTVHSPVFAKSPGELLSEGDAMLRKSYHRSLGTLLAKRASSPPIRSIVDIGCSTGLSTAALHQHFPDALIRGIDLSPHMLAGRISLPSSSQITSAQRKLLCSRAASPRHQPGARTGKARRQDHVLTLRCGGSADRKQKCGFGLLVSGGT
jgi:tRNA G46 methylase TrmB